MTGSRMARRGRRILTRFQEQSILVFGLSWGVLVLVFLLVRDSPASLSPDLEISAKAFQIPSSGFVWVEDVDTIRGKLLLINDDNSVSAVQGLLPQCIRASSRSEVRTIGVVRSGSDKTGWVRETRRNGSLERTETQYGNSEVVFLYDAITVEPLGRVSTSSISYDTPSYFALNEWDLIQSLIVRLHVNPADGSQLRNDLTAWEWVELNPGPAAAAFALLPLLGFWMIRHRRAHKAPGPSVGESFHKTLAEHAPASKTTCDRCGGSFPSGFYLEKSHDGRYLCENCRVGHSEVAPRSAR
jgi:hypothetical protein